MRFARKFSRFIGALPPGGKLLGSDLVPTARPRNDDDRVLFSRLNDSNGWPVHRIAVGYTGPGGALPLPTDIYIFDDLSNAWFKVNASPITLVSGRLTFFDVLGVLPPPQGARTDATAGSLEASLVVSAAGADPAGEYIFVVAPDLTTIGTDGAGSSLGTVDQGTAGTDPWLVRDMNKLVPLVYDFIDLTYVGVGDDRISVAVFKTGGSGGTTVATLTITYIGATDQIDTVTRT